MKSLQYAFIGFVATFLIFSNVMEAQQYKDLIDNREINIHEVIEAAEEYFETHDTGKGSGWKNYQRWKYHN